jgi:hypothetical protein
MKTIQIILLSAILISAASCKKDFLDRQATDAIPEDKIFNDPALMQLFVNNMYLDIPGFERGFPPGLLNNITDESRSYWGGAPTNVLQGQWFADNNPLELWDYTGVRKTNMFLEKVDASPADEEEKAILKGQVKVLRAFLYFRMVKRYGGVPLITKAQTLEDDLFVPRETMDNCFNFIVSELEEAVEMLPETYGDRALDVGKFNKHSAKALLGRVLLFWASPLYNPGGDNSRWEKAAAVNREVIETQQYSLHADFRRIMLDKNNNEEVFSVQYLKGFREHGYDSWAMPDSRSKQMAVAHSPVQEFVDAFEMKNGKRIDANPYENRDPRFLQTVIVNGSIFGFQNLPVWMYVGADIDGINKPYATVTGYLLRKGTDETNKDYYGLAGSDQNFNELRYAEVLLNYAEAQNEALPAPDASVYNAIEQIRQRAGLDPYQLPAGLTKEQMRERIWHERYIELSFEFKRYWDLRRWKVAKEVLDGKKFNAMYITKTGDEQYSYEAKPVDGVPCVFQEKMYFMPIPQREIEKNPNLEQNEDW